MEITEKLSEIKRTSKKLIENSKSQIKRVKQTTIIFKIKEQKFNPDGPGSNTYESIKNLTTKLGQLIERESAIDQKMKDSEKTNQSSRNTVKDDIK